MHEHRFVSLDRQAYHLVLPGTMVLGREDMPLPSGDQCCSLAIKRFANGSAGHPRSGGRRPPWRYITALRSKGQGKLARCRCSGFAHQPADSGQKVRAPVMLGPRCVKFHWGVILHGSCKAHESFSTSTTLRTFLLWRVTVQIHKNNGCHSNSRIIP